MKKILLMVSTLSIIFVPITAIISCNKKTKNETKNETNDETNTNKKDLTDEIAKLQNFTTTDAANETIENNFVNEIKGANVTSKFKNIFELRSIITDKNLRPGRTKPLLSFLSQGISINKVIVKTPYNKVTKTLKVTVTLTNSNNVEFINNTKNIIITFNTLLKYLTDEIAKLQSFTTVDKIDKVGNDMSQVKGQDKIVSKFLAITEVAAALSSTNPKLGLNKPLSSSLSPGVSINQVFVKEEYSTTDKQLLVSIDLKYEPTDGIEYRTRYSVQENVIITFSD